MKTNDFLELYRMDVDFKDLVDYLCKLSKPYSKMVDIAESGKLEKDNKINDVEAESIRTMIMNSAPLIYRIINEKASDAIKKYVEKLLTKEMDGVQTNVHNG